MEKSKQIKATITKNLFFFLLFLTGITNAQIVNIPDANFKAALIAYGVDTNADGEIQVSEALDVTSLPIDNSNISSLSGIEAFTNLTYLNCENNLITSLNVSGLTNLVNLYCGYNPIETFNYEGLTNLQGLLLNNTNIVSADLTQYPSLAGLSLSNCPSLVDVNVSGLTNLINLNLLDCVSLENIQASGCSNLIHSYLSNSPNIQTINFSNCTSLAQQNYSYFPNLKNLDLSNCTSLSMITLNSLSELEFYDFTGCVSLSWLTLNSCNLNNINISDLPVLSHLEIQNSNFSSILLENLPGLSYLTLSNNLSLTDLNIISCPNILSLNMNNNQLSDVDLSMLPSLYNLDFTNNLATTSLNLKNGNIEPFVSIIANPNLEFVCVDEEQIEEVQQAIFSPNTVVNSYCSFTPGGNYNTIKGNMKFDAENNGCDATDASQPYIRLNIATETYQTAVFANDLGDYRRYVLEGNYTITPSIENPSWFTFTPLDASITFADNNNNIATQDFCITANGVHDDLEVVITPILPARPGFDAVYKLSLRNKGNQTLNSWTGLLLNYDATKMSFVSSSTLADTSISGQLGFGYFINPFETISTEITFHINSPTDNPPVNIGDILNFTSSITIANDELPADNVFNYNQTVVGSYDPNNIICIEGEVVPPTEIGNYLHYVVNFENTGTAPAENVVVKVVVNTTDFDMDSLQLMNTSHPVDARINGNIVEFIFQSINLDSGGHGNVLLKIKSKNNLQQGDVVEKKADIYFDYNFPIATNDYETTFQLLSNPDVAIDNSVSIYPNPARNNVNITSKNTIKTIELYDVQGRVLQSQVIDSQSSTMDISSKSKGVYILKISTDKGVKLEKLIKE